MAYGPGLAQGRGLGQLDGDGGGKHEGRQDAPRRVRQMPGGLLQQVTRDQEPGHNERGGRGQEETEEPPLLVGPPVGSVEGDKAGGPWARTAAIRGQSLGKARSSGAMTTIGLRSRGSHHAPYLSVPATSPEWNSPPIAP